MAQNNSKSSHYVGLDIGGTKILAGVFSGALELRGSAKVSTKAQRGLEAVLERIQRAVLEAVDEADLSVQDLRAVGVGVPGAVDRETGQVIFAPNLNWRDVSLQPLLEKLLGLPVIVENDCNMAAVGIYVSELKSKPKNMLGIFVGTGIGGGLIVNGELFRGSTHSAGEIGHMVLEVGGPKCGCGNRGCFEALASRTAMVQRIKAALKDGQKTGLTDLLGEDLADLRSGDLRRALRRGDKLVQRVVEEAAEYMGIAVANLANILNPEVVVLGGGIMEALADDMLSIVIETAKDYAMPSALRGVDITTSNLGDHAGIIGGAVLAHDLMK